MKINSVYLSYDIYDKKQMEAVQSRGKSMTEACSKIKDTENLTNDEKESIKSEVYGFFTDVFGDEKAFEVLGENANLTECIVACAEFMRQSKEITDSISGIANFGNRQMRRTIVHKRK